MKSSNPELFDLHLERSLLCSLMIDTRLFSEFRSRLNALWYNSVHKEIWEWMRDNNEHDVTIIGARFPNHSEALARIMDTDAHVNICGIVDILNDLYFRRILVDATDRARQQAVDRDEKVFDTLKIFRESTKEISDRTRKSGPEHVRDILPRVLSELEQKMTGTGAVGIVTDIEDLDNYMGPMEPGELILLAARPSMGKSALALQIIASAAVRGKRILVFSLEMTKTLCVSRMICAKANIPIYIFNNGAASNDNLRAIGAECGKIAELNIFIDDTPGLDIDEIISRAELHKRIHGIDLVVVDHAQLVCCKGARTRVEEMSEVSKEMKNLARSLNIPNICLSQLSRACESRNPPRPMLSDLRDSGTWEQDADKVVLLFRPAYYDHGAKAEDKNVCEVIVGKNRNGPTGKCKLFFEPASMQFRGMTKNGENW